MKLMEQHSMPEEACQALLAYLLRDEHVLRQQLEASTDLVALLSPPTAEGSGAPPMDQADPDLRWFRFLGDILWEIFSQNNEVLNSDGRVYDLGSWRGSGGFIADFLNAYLKREQRIEAGAGDPFFYLVSFAKDDEEDPASYDPASAVQKELEEESSTQLERAEDDLAQHLARSNEAAYGSPSRSRPGSCGPIGTYTGRCRPISSRVLEIIPQRLAYCA